MTALTERRKADRAVMADRLAEAAQQHGASATIESWPDGYDPRCVVVHIEGPRGLRVGIAFDGASPQPDVHVVSWHIKPGFDTRFAAGFAPSINEYHRHKATDIAHGIDELCEIVAARLDAAMSGKAFEESEQ